MTLLEFKNEYLGKTVGFPDGKYVGECLSLVKWYIKKCFGIDPPPSGTNSAYGYWSNFPNPLGTVFEKVKNEVNTIPKSGWIAIWKPWDGNPYGHIDVVLEGADKNQFPGLDQNWGGRQAQVVKHDYDNVVGFLKPKVINSPDQMTSDESKALEILKRFQTEFKHSSLEGATSAAVGAYADLNKAQEKIRSLEADCQKYQVVINDLTAKLLVEQKAVSDCQSQLATAKEYADSLERQKNDNWMLYKNKNDEYNTLLLKTQNPVELVRLFIQLFKK